MLNIIILTWKFYKCKFLTVISIFITRYNNIWWKNLLGVGSFFSSFATSINWRRTLGPARFTGGSSNHSLQRYSTPGQIMRKFIYWCVITGCRSRIWLQNQGNQKKTSNRNLTILSGKTALSISGFYPYTWRALRPLQNWGKSISLKIGEGEYYLKTKL